MNIDVLYIDNPYVAGFLDEKKWVGQFIGYSGRQIFKLLPEYTENFSRDERIAIRDYVYSLRDANHLKAQQYIVKESNGENMKKRISILEALSEIPELDEGSYSGMYEDKENLNELDLNLDSEKTIEDVEDIEFKKKLMFLKDNVGITLSIGYPGAYSVSEPYYKFGDWYVEAAVPPSKDPDMIRLTPDNIDEKIKLVLFFDHSRDGDNKQRYKSWLGNYAKTNPLNESYNWDKFNKDLMKRERNNLRDAKKKRINEHSPQREYNKRYKEDWRNSTRWTK